MTPLMKFRLETAFGMPSCGMSSNTLELAFSAILSHLLSVRPMFESCVPNKFRGHTFKQFGYEVRILFREYNRAEHQRGIHGRDRFAKKQLSRPTRTFRPSV